MTDQSNASNAKTHLSRWGWIVLILCVMALLLMLSPLIGSSLSRVFALNVPERDDFFDDSETLIAAINTTRLEYDQYPSSLLEVGIIQKFDTPVNPTFIHFEYNVYPDNVNPDRYVLSFRKRGAFFQWYCYYSDTEQWSLSYFRCPATQGSTPVDP